MTRSSPILRPNTNKASTTASSSDQMVSRFVIASYNALMYHRWCSGAAATYIPMSLHIPDLVRSIRAHQETLADIQAWWLTTKQASPMTPSAECPQLCAMPQSGNLAGEISAAMDEDFPNNNDVFATSDFIKTSESHPIK